MNWDQVKVGQKVLVRKGYGKDSVVTVIGPLRERLVALQLDDAPFVVNEDSITKWDVDSAYLGKDYFRCFPHNLCLRVKQ